MSQCLGKDDARTVLIAQREVGRRPTDYRYRSHVRHEPGRCSGNGSRRGRRAKEKNRDGCGSEGSRERTGSVHAAIMQYGERTPASLQRF